MHAEELYESEICWFDNPMSFGKALSEKSLRSNQHYQFFTLSVHDKFPTKKTAQFVYFESCVCMCVGAKLLPLSHKTFSLAKLSSFKTGLPMYLILKYCK